MQVLQKMTRGTVSSFDKPLLLTWVLEFRKSREKSRSDQSPEHARTPNSKGQKHFVTASEPYHILTGGTCVQRASSSSC